LAEGTRWRYGLLESGDGMRDFVDIDLDPEFVVKVDVDVDVDG
jgi:hypothetical protein